MKRTLTPLLASLSLHFATNAQSPPVLWQQQADAVGASVLPTCSATDGQGAQYVAGHFGDALYVGNAMLQAVDPPSSDIFLCKFGADGALLWMLSFGSEGTDQVFGLCIDPVDNVLICGRTSSDSIALGGITVHKGASNFAGFWAKFNPSGQCLVARTTECLAEFPALSNTSINGIDTDAAGNIHITGGWRADTLRFDGHLLVNQRPDGQVVGTNVFVARFDPGGTCLWLIGNAPGTVPGNSNAGYAISARESGKLYVAGTFGGVRMVLGTRTLGVFDLDEGFYASMEADHGAVNWVRAVRGANVASNTYDAVNDIRPDGNGHVYLGGNFVGHQLDLDSLQVLPSPVDPDANKGFLFKVNGADGLPAWGRVLGESATGSGAFVGLALRPTAAQLGVALNYTGNVVFDPVAPPFAGTTNGAVLIADTAGTFLNGTALEGTGVQLITGLSYDLSGDLRVCGKYNGDTAQLGTALWWNQQQPNVHYSMALCKLGAGPNSVAEEGTPQELAAYPNPCTTTLHLRAPGAPTDLDYGIHAPDGRTVCMGRAKRHGDVVGIPVEHLRPGSYLLRLQGGRWARTVRFVHE